MMRYYGFLITIHILNQTVNVFSCVFEVSPASLAWYFFIAHIIMFTIIANIVTI